MTTERETVQVKVVNTSLTPVTLYKNSRLTIAEQINESAICSIGESSSHEVTPMRSENKCDEITLEPPCLRTSAKRRKNNS